MTAMINPQVFESDLPLQVLYNDKIEHIRMLEYNRDAAPHAIKFDLSDGLSGIESHKSLRIQSDSAP